MKNLTRALPMPAIPLLLLVVPALASTEGPAATARADYERLQQWRASPPVPVPDGGIRFQRDTATWTLESGTLRYLEPTSEGRLTGLVFEGRGRFRMEVPDVVEVRQLRRMAEDHGLAGLDEPFTALVLRTSGELPVKGFPAPSEGGFTPDDLARARHEHWLEHHWDDVDARVVAGLRMPGDDYLRVEVRSERFDWLTYDFDPLRHEEARLSRWDRRTGAVEHWISLDRAADRRPNGRPGQRRVDTFDLVHVEVAADLREAARRVGSVGWTGVQARMGRLTAELTLTPRTGGGLAVPLELHPFAEVTAVRDSDHQVPFLRDHIGGRDAFLDKLLHDDDLVVLLDRPLAAGEERSLSFDYRILFLGYAPGRAWYPGAAEGFRDRHTVSLDLLAPDKLEVRAMGERTEDREAEGRARRTRFVVDQPVRMATFTFADGFHEEAIEREGLPTVVALGPRGRSDSVFDIAADTVNSLQFFDQVFDVPLGAERLQVTAIPGFHGQSFDGFIHLSDVSVLRVDFGRGDEARSRFHAHEVAHQWWGHVVAWDSYRDQWLSEAFAEYSAMMFLEATVGEEAYEEIVRAYTELAFGSIKPNRYLLPGEVERNDELRKKIGPISVGYRASTGATGRGYVHQTYYKGALVLHMLRTMLRNLTKSDDTFVRLLHEFLETHRGREASTEDFFRTLTRVAPADWGWFFDQWVFSTAVPTYVWEHDVERAGEGFAVVLDVEQRGVPAGFKMPVPVAFDFGGGRTGQAVVLIDEPRERIRLPVPERPRAVELNPGHAVMAKVEKR